MHLFATGLLIIISVFSALAQPFATPQKSDQASSKGRQSPVVKVTGVRFTYPLVQQWIDKFSVEHPDIQVIIESRGSSDPSQYDILVEAYEHPENIRQEREYVYVARYAVLPIASKQSVFARVYGEKGLDKNLITQLFFHDLYADKDLLADVKAPYTVYTRLQKAGAPIVFSNYFGYEQRDIKGKAIAGSDEHLVKALLRDTTGISFAPVPVIYDRNSGSVVDGISVLPVDLNGNRKLGDDEKFYARLDAVTSRLEAGTDLNNVPIAYIHFSVDKKYTSAEVITFLKWIIEHSEEELHAFGYLKPEPGKLDKARFDQFALKHIKQ